MLLLSFSQVSVRKSLLGNWPFSNFCTSVCPHPLTWISLAAASVLRLKSVFHDPVDCSLLPNTGLSSDTDIRRMSKVCQNPYNSILANCAWKEKSFKFRSNNSSIHNRRFCHMEPSIASYLQKTERHIIQFEQPGHGKKRSVNSDQ